MKLLQIVASALGLRRRVVVRPPAPLSCTRAARERLSQLLPHQAATLRCHPSHDGQVVHITEGPAPTGVPHTAIDGLHASPDDWARCAGLRLDYDQGRWRVQTSIQMQPFETPNPNQRMYHTDRTLQTGRPIYTRSPAPHPDPLSQRILAIPGVVAVLLRENTLTIEREIDVSWIPLDREVLAALHQHLLRCGTAVSTRQQHHHSSDLEAAVWRIIQTELLPTIHKDGGDLVLVGVTSGVARVQLRGACTRCPASTLTLRGSVERVLTKAFPQHIQRVEAE